MATLTTTFMVAPLKCVKSFVSEAQESCTEFQGHEKGGWTVVCDPLDGAQNVDSAVNIGSIFAIVSTKGTTGHESYGGKNIRAAGETVICVFFLATHSMPLPSLPFRGTFCCAHLGRFQCRLWSLLCCELLLTQAFSCH